MTVPCCTKNTGIEIGMLPRGVARETKIGDELHDSVYPIVHDLILTRLTITKQRQATAAASPPPRSIDGRLPITNAGVEVDCRLLLFTSVFLGCYRRLTIPGIWKLCLSDESLKYLISGEQQDIAARARAKLMKIEEEDKLLVKLNPDGTFQQCSEFYQEGRWIGGRWSLQTDQGVVLLAFDRQYYGPRFDILLIGELSDTAVTSIGGRVYTGNFMYPKKHPAFFDGSCCTETMNATGTFVLVQSIATRSILPEYSPVSSLRPKYKISSFVDKPFLLIVEPINGRIGKDETGKAKAEDDARPYDLRTMRVQFHGNSTFQAFAPNKILRGRFSLQQSIEGEHLQFQVSLFGAGRSAPGSVYSEGRGLSHDDERYYTGIILEDTASRLHVKGIVLFGSDLGSDARPEPVGRFQLMEASEDDDVFS
jgi:hypothetical protein